MSSQVVRREVLKLVDEAKSNGATLRKISPIIGYSHTSLHN